MQSLQRLLAGLLIATALPVAVWAAEVTGSIEAGAAGVATKDSPLRVNEYSTIRPDDGAGAYGKMDLGVHSGGLAVDVGAEVFGSRDQKYDLNLDVNRIFRLQSDYQKFQHWLGHDQLNYLDAAVPAPSSWSAGEALGPDAIPSFWSSTANTGANGSTRPNGTYQQIGRASVYGEDLTPGADFNIRYSEWENKADITLPQLPNLTFHTGYREQRREGIEQSIGMSKCTACHITGGSRNVDEKTKDLSAGVTGKFGGLTVDYTFLDREFREQADVPMRWYDPALSPTAAYTTAFGTFDNRILYDYDQPGVTQRAYDTTPDSDKQSHVLKARYDFSRDTSLVGSWINAIVDSDKTSEANVFTLSDDNLETKYDSYAFKFATKLLPQLKVSLRGKIEEVDADDVTLTFIPNNPVVPATLQNLGGGTVSGLTRTYDAIASRDILTLNADAIYRLTPKSSVKLGYEFQEVDRDDDHYDTTKSHSIEATYRAKYSKSLSTRVSYNYKKIDEPFQHIDAAGFIDPTTGLPYTTNSNSGLSTAPAISTGDLYGTAFYDLRQTDLSNLPEDIHEGKASVTWSPKPNLSATVSYRIKMEENDLDRSTWEQTTHSPSLSLWYAPTGDLSFTFAYNYFAQATEAKFCQGWYDG